MVYGVLRYFQQYFSYIVAEETGVPGENHRPVASHYLYYRKNVVLANFDWLYVIFKIEESIFFMILFAYSHFTMNVLQEGGGHSPRLKHKWSVSKGYLRWKL